MTDQALLTSRFCAVCECTLGLFIKIWHFVQNIVNWLFSIFYYSITICCHKKDGLVMSRFVFYISYHFWGNFHVFEIYNVISQWIAHISQNNVEQRIMVFFQDLCCLWLNSWGSTGVRLISNWEATLSMASFTQTRFNSSNRLPQSPPMFDETNYNLLVRSPFLLCSSLPHAKVRGGII